MMELMAVDKKVKAGKLHLVLLKSIGHSVISSEIDVDMVHATIEACRAK